MNNKARLNVLVVDDDVDAAYTLADLVCSNGHDARVACDGRSAIRNLRNADYQLMLLDIGLPDMDGYEIVRRVTLLGQSGLTIVGLSGGSGSGDEGVSRSSVAGLDELIAKPCGSDQLERIFRKAIERSR